MRMHLSLRIIRLIVLLRPFQWVSKPSGWLEAYSGTLAWVWAAVSIFNPDLFALTPSYRVMGHIADELFWAVAFSIVGALHSISLCAGCHPLRSPACLASAFMWVFVGVLFGLAQDFKGLASWLYLDLGVFCMLAGVKNARE